MRTGAAADHVGYFHETAFYGSDEEFLAVVIPFLEEGLRVGEPTLSAFAEHNTHLVRSVLGAPAGLVYLDGDVRYARPATTITLHRHYLTEQVRAGAAQIRIVGDVPHPGMGASWDWWARYEIAVNHAYNDFPLWGMCPYDTRTTPDWVLDDVLRTHPHIATADGGHHRNDQFGELDSVFGSRTRPPMTAWLSGPAHRTLIDPCPRASRVAVRELPQASELSIDEVDALVYAVSEAITNATLYGRPPIELALREGPGWMSAAVTDRGPGPVDVRTGLVPLPPSTPGTTGTGLWIAHQQCADVGFAHHDDGFTATFTVGAPPASCEDPPVTHRPNADRSCRRPGPSPTELTPTGPVAYRGCGEKPAVVP